MGKSGFTQEQMLEPTSKVYINDIELLQKLLHAKYSLLSSKNHVGQRLKEMHRALEKIKHVENIDRIVEDYYKNMLAAPDIVSDTDSKPVEQQIGVLNKEWGLNYFKPALPGHPVYDDGSRYVIYLKPENGGDSRRVTFYKDTLTSWISFC